MGRPSAIPTPAFALRLAFGEKTDILLASQRQVPEKLKALGFEWKFPTLEGALRDLLKK
jgi:NAD dependent epimerase/dehydratase family enzyme